MRINTSHSNTEASRSPVGEHGSITRSTRTASHLSSTAYSVQQYQNSEIQNKSSPVHFRHFSTPVPHFSSGSQSPNNTQVHNIVPSPQAPPPSFSCSPYQPLPLVFPIYYADKFYMSTTPLPPGYFIRPVP